MSDHSATLTWRKVARRYPVEWVEGEGSAVWVWLSSGNKNIRQVGKVQAYYNQAFFR